MSLRGEGNSTVVRLLVGYAWWSLYYYLVSFYASKHCGSRRNLNVIVGWN
ncbi:hypothetical protein Syun_024192 [Stephania yunnanensis]|uniref:Transmembrane protein n=1 Tax=Stephania yunnanensis TaxID=152371 RepID=A0AAP0I3R9_9MAGN